MISKHVSCKPQNDDYGRLARYIADAGHEGEKCLVSWSAGCWSGDDYGLGILEAEAVQDLNTRSAREKTYHLLISFRPEDEARLTPGAFRAIEKRFAQALGFSEHQRHCGVHKNTNNLHLHIAYNMIHPERLSRHDPFRDYKTLSETCRKLEQEYGLTVDNGMEKARADRLSEKAAAIEAQTGQESFESYAKRHKAHILKALENSQDWQGFHEAIRAIGMEAKAHGNGLVIKDLNGDHAVKASAIDRALSMKKLEGRFGQFQPYRSLRPVQEVSRYQAVPLHRGPERGELFAKYRQGIESRKIRLEAVREREGAALAAIRKQWADKRAEIERMGIAKLNRRNLFALACKHEAEAIAKARVALQPEREAVRRDIPFVSWNGFLRHEAGQGNEIALAVLRSKGETVEPEQEVAQPKVKDWSQHGREQFLTGKADHTAKERALLEREDISAKAKKPLQAFLRMERIAEASRTQGYDLGDITRRIDGKGIVIFTLASGGSIRDTGKELFYSAHDEKAYGVALAYATLKWGKNIAQEKGKILFRKTPEIEREQERGWGR
jgi:hypothetical protein